MESEMSKNPMTDPADTPQLRDPFKVDTIRRNPKMPKWLQCGRRPYKRVSPAGRPPSATYYSANGLTFYTIYDIRAMIRAGRKRK